MTDGVCNKFLQWRICTSKAYMMWFLYSHMKEEIWFELEGSVGGGHCCWLDAQAAFRSSKSFREILDVLFCCWFGRQKFFTSSLMRFTVSSNEEDSHDALSSTVDCASAFKDKNVISTQIAMVMRKAGDQRASDMLTNCCYFPCVLLYWLYSVRRIYNSSALVTGCKFINVAFCFEQFRNRCMLTIRPVRNIRFITISKRSAIEISFASVRQWRAWPACKLPTLNEIFTPPPFVRDLFPQETSVHGLPGGINWLVKKCAVCARITRVTRERV